MLRWVLLVTLVVAGCREKKVTPDDGQLSVRPAMIDFGAVWAGFPVSRTTSVAFSGMSSCEVTLSASAPFAVTPSVHLEKASSANIEVSVHSSGAGMLTGTLTVTGCGHTASASLAASSFAVPDCGSEGACTTVRFDPDAGLCTTARKPDGLACADACLTQPHCNAGQCVGTLVSCDDNDACTLDACGLDGGCVHVPGQSFCPPLPGCSAQCDGGACGTLTEVWSRPPDATPDENLLADEQGNLYWLEDDNALDLSGWLVSVSRTGVLRYRVGVLLVSGETWPMYAQGSYIYLQRYGGTAFAFRGSDGAFSWYRRMVDDVVDAGHPEAGSVVYVPGRAALGNGGQALFPISFPGTNVSEGYAVTIDAQTGTLVGVTRLPSLPHILETDERGWLYEGVQGSSGDHLEVFDPSLFWSFAAGHTLGPVAAGRVFTPDALLDADGGALIAAFNGNEIAPDIATPSVAVRRDTILGRFVFFDPLTGVERGRAQLPDLADWELFALEAGEVLAVNRGGENRIDGFDADGGHLYECDVPLEPGHLLFGRPVLIDNLLLVWGDAPAGFALHAYAMPGRREAAHGWVARFGSAARTNRPK